MKKIMIVFVLFAINTSNIFSQQCLTTKGCTSYTKEYPSVNSPYNATNSWQLLKNPANGNDAYMNGGNYTRFNVISGNTYEWTYCEENGGVSTSWDAQLTLLKSDLSTQLCFSTDVCGTKAPYIKWTANYTGIVCLLTTAYFNGTGCQSNTGTYNKLVYRMIPVTTCTTPGTPSSATGTATSQNSANLSWTAGNITGSSTVTYYWVVGTSSSVTYGGTGVVAQGTTTALSASTTSLSCGTTYYLRVYAKTSCDGTNSEYKTSGAFTTTSCITSSLLFGIDVSHYQGTINWNQVRESGLKNFAYVKATEGIDYNDSYFKSNMINGNAAGLKMGAYHLARPDNKNSAIDEANHFLEISGSFIGNNYLPPALDLEPLYVESLGKAALSAWLEEWMNQIKKITSVSPIIYTTIYDASNLLNSKFSTYGLWIANYETNPSTSPKNLGIWSTWVFNQYSETGIVPGITGYVDLDVFNGDATSLNNLINSTSITHPTNDNCNNAIALNHNSNCNFTYGTIDNATEDGFNDLPKCNGSSATQNGVFYKFAATTTSAKITVDPINKSDSGLDAVVVVYTGSDCYNLREFDCADPDGNVKVEKTLTGLNIGQTYWIRIYDFGLTQPPLGNGGFNICVSQINTATESPKFDERIKIYPNPTTGKFEVSGFEDFGSNLTIDIINFDGKIIYSKVISNQESLISIDLSNHPNGLYLVRFSNEKTTFIRKLIKK
jgi:lysozyme